MMHPPSHLLRLDESARTELIGQLAVLIKCQQMPDNARQAGLTLIGWLARRMPQDQAAN